MSRLNWNDPEAVRLWLYGLRESFADLDAAGRDMLRPERKRRLGPMTHASLYRDARAQIRISLAYAEPAKPAPRYPGPSDNDEHGDPAGSGGSGAE